MTAPALPTASEIKRTVAEFLAGLAAKATDRQRATAANLACETVEFERHTLTALQATVLHDDLVRRSRETNRPADYDRRNRLYAEIMAAHKAVIKANVANLVRQAARTVGVKHERAA